MCNPLAHASERREAVEAAAPEDEQVGLAGELRQGFDRPPRVGHDVRRQRLDAIEVDRCAAGGGDEQELGAEALGDLFGHAGGGERVIRPVDADEDARGEGAEAGPPGVDRRSFFRTLGMSAAGAMALTGEAAAQAASNVVQANVRRASDGSREANFRDARWMIEPGPGPCATAMHWSAGGWAAAG